jgi:hypothetical protein
MEVETDGDWAFICPLKLKADVLAFNPGKLGEHRVLLMSYIPNYQGPVDFELRAEPFTFLTEEEAGHLSERLQQWRSGEFGPHPTEAPGLVADYIVDQARRKMME